MTGRVTVTRDSFLEPMGLTEVAAGLRSPEQVDALYRLVLEYAAEAGAVEDLPESGVGMGELPLRLPGGYSLSLGKLDLGSMQTLLALGGVLLSMSFPPAGITLAAVVLVQDRLTKLKAEYGERSVVDAVAETKPATVRDVTLALYGKPCRHPDAGCRFVAAATGTCGIGLDAVGTTLDALVERKVLARLNAVEPIEYGIAL